LSNGFSRKLENHIAAVALQYFVYNFVPNAGRDARNGDWRHRQAVGSVRLGALLEAAESKKAA
jgi:hypothetical protein